MDQGALDTSAAWSRARATRDRRLLDRARGGDTPAFERLYEELASPLVAYLAVLLSDRTVAETAFEDTILAITNGESGFDPTHGPLIAWAATVARKRASVRLRLARAKPRMVDVEGKVGRREPATNESDFSLPFFIRELPCQEREVVFLRYALYLSDLQIAEIQGSTEKVVRRLRIVALEVLRARMRNDAGESRAQRHHMRVRTCHSPVLAQRRAFSY